MSPLTTNAQSLKFEYKTPMKHNWKAKKPRKAQEGHLDEGTPQKPIKGMESGKIKRGVRKAQNQRKSSKSALPLKSNSP
jgi:hypothetical protein